MRAQPVPAEVFGTALGDAMQGEAAGVGADDGARAAHGFDAGEQRLLDLQPLGHRFDDPVGLAQPLEVVVEVPGAEALGVVGKEEGLGVGLARRRQARLHDAVAHGRTCERQPALLFLFGQLAGDDIE